MDETHEIRTTNDASWMVVGGDDSDAELFASLGVIRLLVRGH
jgi:hypothetical protein